MAQEQEYGPLGMQYGQFGVQPPQVDVPGLGGFAQGTSFNNYQTNQGLQTVLNEMIVKANQNRLDEYGANAGVRESGREASIATNKATAGTVGDLKRGEADTAKAGGQVAMGTAQGKVAAGNAQTAGQVDTEKLKKAERDIENLNMVLPAFINHPKGRDEFNKWADQQGWKADHPYRKYLAEGDGADFGDRLTKIRDHAMMNLETQRKLQPEIVQQDSAIVREGMQQSGANYRAQLADAQRRDQAARQAESRQRQNNLQQEVTALRQSLGKALRAKPRDEVEIGALREELQYMTSVLFQERAAGATMYPDLSGQNVQFNRPPTGNVAPPGGGGAAPPGTGGLPPGVKVTPR